MNRTFLLQFFIHAYNVILYHNIITSKKLQQKKTRYIEKIISYTFNTAYASLIEKQNVHCISTHRNYKIVVKYYGEQFNIQFT